MNDPVRFALIGTGGIAQSYLQAFENAPITRLVAVADVRSEPARAMAELAGCPAFPSHESIPTAELKLDAVVICTPPNTHEEIASHFLKRRINVLCEKPFTLDSASARRMIALSKESGVILTMASKFRYVEDVIRAKSIVASHRVVGDMARLASCSNSWLARFAPRPLRVEGVPVCIVL